MSFPENLTQECPEGSLDYRDLQCAEFNENHQIPSVPKKTNWTAKIIGSNNMRQPDFVSEFFIHNA